MSEDVKRFPPNKSLSALGINVKAPTIGADLTLDETSLNLSTGIYEGIGPRFGSAPLANHSTFEPAESGYANGLAYWEASPGAGDRRKVFHVFKATLGDYSTAGSPVFVNGYVWIVSRTYNSSSTTDFVDAWVAVRTPTGVSYYPSSEIAGGFRNTNGAYPNSAEPNFINLLFCVCSNSPTWRVNAQGFFQFPTTRGYARTALITVSGADIPMAWMIGAKRTNGSSTVPCTASYGIQGFPTSWSTRQFQNSLRAVSVIDSASVAGLQYQYDYNYSEQPPAGTALYTEAHWMVSAANTTANTVPAQFGTATVTTRIDGAASAASSVDYELLHDPAMVCNSGYTLYCAAVGGNPVAYMTKPWLANDDGGSFIWPVTLTIDALKPPDLRTSNVMVGGRYEENGSPRTSCFNNWPNYDTGVALTTNAAETRDSTHMVTLGDANSGILRANTDYEFTFSLYNKLSGHETNVGSPVRFRTGTDEFVALSILRDTTSTGSTGGTLRQRLPLTGLTPPIYPLVTATSGFTAETTAAANYLEIRFYYRVYGSFEWLPALFIDVAKFLGYPNFDVLWACTGAIASLPGGQPGGFNDYSPLPSGNYIDCVEFQERMFWLTEQTICWSYKRNPFAYAGRNSAACKTGIFLGAVVHVNKGQRMESNTSRLLICGSEAIYVGRFTGEPFTAPVVVSPDTVQEFPLEGSDFLIDFWTSFTAYGPRAMVVADGNLYYWGPTGAFFDEGLGDPERISSNLEPDLFSLVDATKTDQVFGFFCEGTGEVIWCYPPANGDGTSTGVLSYNTETGQFQYGEIEGQVDAAQTATITRESVNWIGIAGSRQMVFTRPTSSDKISRAYYMDQRCLGGDVRPFADMLANGATLLTGNDWRFTIETGSVDTTNAATIAVGDYIAFLQFAAYTRNYVDNRTDFVGKVLAKGTTGGRNYLDIRLPDEITLNASSPVTFPTTRCPPMWHMAAAGAGLNAFQWRIATNYWAPAGIDFEAFWKWAHAIFVVDLLASADPFTYELSSRTPQNDRELPVDYQFRDNFAGHDQAYIPLVMADGTVPQSQALKLVFEGYQIASTRVLQYLSIHGAGTKRVDFFKEFMAEKA